MLNLLYLCRTRIEQPETIRGRFGATDTRNATHGSDSPETAAREVNFFFPEFSIGRWFEVEEKLYRMADKISEETEVVKIEFDQETWQHSVAVDR